MSGDVRSYDAIKRVMDLTASIVALVVLSPVMGVTACLVAKRLGRPVFFVQDRPGLGGKVFRLKKFRTMLNVDEGLGVTSNEQRMTPFGMKLRSSSLDELPSLLNVVKGEMSLVGPRPLLVEYLPLYSREQARRHDVRPGLTGLAQVSGRNALDWESRFALDVEYVENRSLVLDAKIIVTTIVRVFQRDGINSEGHVVGAPFTGAARQADDG